MKFLKYFFVLYMFQLFQEKAISQSNLVQVIDDDFNGSQLNTQIWHTQADWGPNYTFGDLQYYLPQNVEENRLNITELFERMEKLEKENEQLKKGISYLKEILRLKNK